MASTDGEALVEVAAEVVALAVHHLPLLEAEGHLVAAVAVAVAVLSIMVHTPHLKYKGILLAVEVKAECH